MRAERLQWKSAIDEPAKFATVGTMKGLAAVVFLCALSSAPAQVASDFRIVDGQLYNVQKSVLWTDIPPKNTSDPNYHQAFLFYGGRVEIVGQTSLLVRINVETVAGPASGHDWDGRLVLIKNHPKQRTFTTGDKFPRDRFFPVGNHTLTNRAKDQTITVKVYDYGLPNTPENRAQLRPNSAKQ